MLEAVLADIAQQFLQPGNFNHSGTAKRLERIVRESPATRIAADFCGNIVSGKAGETHGAGFDSSHACPESIFHADGSSDDRLVVHFHLTEEMLGKIAAVEADRFVGIGAVIVIPVEQGAWALRSELQGVHAKNSADVYFTSAGE